MSFNYRSPKRKEKIIMTILVPLSLIALAAFLYNRTLVYLERKREKNETK